MNFFERFKTPQGESGQKYDGEMPVDEQKELGEIRDTNSFQKAIESGNLELAETWLNKIKTERPENYDERWIDHRERELFRAYYGEQRWVDAKRIVENSVKSDSKQGRADRLAELSGIKYEEI
ncbi:hypothetical protein H6761_01285 [Candidatus Nomurabacteria bacterium]|nr:hypothetical protein [Candidatus Nomurabacteria bacterium]